MKIIISPYSSKLRSGLSNAKNYPYWKEFISLLEVNNEIVQIGVNGEKPLVKDYRFNLKLHELNRLLDSVDTFISVDNFFPHFCHYHGRHGTVIFSKSDPLIFGYKENLNILKDRKYLRPFQFQTWDECPFDLEAFHDPETIYNIVCQHLFNNR